MHLRKSSTYLRAMIQCSTYRSEPVFSENKLNILTNFSFLWRLRTRNQGGKEEGRKAGTPSLGDTWSGKVVENATCFCFYMETKKLPHVSREEKNGRRVWDKHRQLLIRSWNTEMSHCAPEICATTASKQNSTHMHTLLSISIHIKSILKVKK